MNIKEVIAIMGTPDSLINFSLQPNTFSFLYNPPFGNSDNFYVTFSKTDSLVLGIIKD